MIEFDASQIDRLAHDIGESAPRTVSKAEAVVTKVGHDVVARAQQIVPVDTGNLRASISVDVDADSLGFEAGPTADYGHYVEFGTSRMSPQPYLLPAFDAMLPSAYDALGRIVGPDL